MTTQHAVIPEYVYRPTYKCRSKYQRRSYTCSTLNQCRPSGGGMGERARHPSWAQTHAEPSADAGIYNKMCEMSGSEYKSCEAI